MTVRTQLAAAATTVAGVNVAAYFRQTTKAGTGMVRLGRIDYPNTLGGVVTWQVVILLPTDLAQAEKWMEAKVPALVAALGVHMTVQRVTPTQLVLETGTVPTVFIEGQREE